MLICGIEFKSSENACCVGGGGRGGGVTVEERTKIIVFYRVPDNANFPGKL